MSRGQVNGGVALVTRGRISPGQDQRRSLRPASRVPRPLSFPRPEEMGARPGISVLGLVLPHPWDFCCMESAVGCWVHEDETA